MRNMGLQDIEKFCGIGPQLEKKQKKQEKRMLTPQAQARKTLRIQSLRRGTPWVPVVIPSDVGYGEDDMGNDLDDDLDDDDEDISDTDSSQASSHLTERSGVKLQLGPRREGEETPKTKSSAASSIEIFSATSMANDDTFSVVSRPISVSHVMR